MNFLLQLSARTLMLLAGMRGSPESLCECPDQARLCGIARDAVAAVELATRLPTTGPAAKEAAVVLLLSIAHHESGFWAEVQDDSLCHHGAWCDRGRSVSLYALFGGVAWIGHSRAEIVGSNLLATRLALHWLAVHARGGTLDAMTVRYAGARGRAARELAHGFDFTAHKVGLKRQGFTGLEWHR